MEALVTTDGSNSNDALKDIEKAKIKMNGDMNGSMDTMDVDADSRDSDYKKDLKDSYSGDGSNDGSSRVNNGGEHTSDTEGDHSEEEDSRDVDSSHSKLKHSENSNSHQGFHESMDIDGDGEGDGESLNSEEEVNLINSDNENEQSNLSKSKADYDADMMEETEEDDIDDEEEENDINREDPDTNDAKSNKDIVDLDSDDHSEAGGKTKSERDRDEEDRRTNGDCRSDADTDGGHSKHEDGTPDGSNSNETPKKKKNPNLSVTPRRSSRTVQKPVRFGQELSVNSSEEEDIEGNESDDIEEITPQDPLADPVADLRKIPRKIGNTTIVVNDTKRLADIAARNTNNQKKEPTLVIIDTNSILSGRGPVPMTPSASSQSHHLPSVTVTAQTHLQPPPQPAPLPQQPHHIKPYPGLPAALPAQGLYPPKPVARPPPILPTLTDDMFVVEAPSFIVPYVYEKPPVKKFKKYLRKMLKQVRKQDEEEAKREEEEEAAEAAAAAAAASKAQGETDKEKKDGDDSEKKLSEEEEAKTKAEPTESIKQENEAIPRQEVVATAKTQDTGKGDEDKVSSTCDSIEDSIKVNEIKKKDDGDVTVKETTPSKKVRGRESRKDADTSSSEDEEEEEEEEKKKPATGGSYFDNPLGKFFMQIGMNLVQEFVQTDLLKQHKKKQKLGKGTEDTQQAIISLKKNLQLSKENNEPYAMEQNKCDYCSFKTESKLIMAHHLETPHMRNYVYRCNFCPLEVRGPHDILFHMEAEHNIRGRLERAPAFHQCPQCPFEDNQKGKLTRHLLTCAKKFRPEKNLEPPLDWEPPAKIPRMTRKPPNMPMNVNNQLYQQALASKNLQHPLLPKMVPALNNAQNALLRARGRPNFSQVPQGQSPKIIPQRPLPPQLARANMVYRAGGSPGSQQVLVPTSYQITGNQIFQVMGPQGQVMNVPANSPAMQRLGFTTNQAASVTSNTPVSQQKNPAAVKLLNQPSISITPLPRQAPSTSSASPANAVQRQAGSAGGGSKSTFVICEICDGYIKDLEQLRNHMQWIHKVKIHPKMIYNRPPLNCQKCQFRFFTDQGLERHLLGSHGLVTSSMQDSANKGKDGGRCPVCGRVYQWKLLNHVARDHNMTLKPAHLSYKCTVCTATFGMYKQFENHVYSAHSVVAKRVMDKKNGQSSSSSVSRPDTATLLKPLKINDEITIIPQPAKKLSTASPAPSRPVPGTSRVSIQPRILHQQSNKPQADSVQIIDLEDSPLKNSASSENGGVESLTAVKERLRRRKSLEIRQVESEPDHSEGESEEYERESTSRSKVNSANEEEDDEEMQQDEEDRKQNDEEDDEEDEDDQDMDQDQDKGDDQDGDESDG